MGIFDNVFSDVNERQPGQARKQTEKEGMKKYMTEFSGEMGYDNFTRDSEYYRKNGVNLLKKSDDTLKLNYDGLLAKNGATELYTVVGYGNNLSWENTEFIPMTKTGQQNFEAEIPIRRDGSINIAFKDSADNWDNNSGLNYSFTN